MKAVVVAQELTAVLFLLWVGVARGAVVVSPKQFDFCSVPSMCRAVASRCGVSGDGSCFEMTGNGTDSIVAIATTNLRVTEVMQTFEIAASIRCEVNASADATPYFGIFGSVFTPSYDTTAADLGNGWKRYSAIMPTRAHDFSLNVSVKFGIWHIKGRCFFDEITVSEAQVVPIDRDGIKLSGGDTVGTDGVMTLEISSEKAMKRTTMWHPAIRSCDFYFNSVLFESFSEQELFVDLLQGGWVALAEPVEITVSFNVFDGSVRVYTDQNSSSFAVAGPFNGTTTYRFSSSQFQGAIKFVSMPTGYTAFGNITISAKTKLTKAPKYAVKGSTTTLVRNDIPVPTNPPITLKIGEVTGLFSGSLRLSISSSSTTTFNGTLLITPSDPRERFDVRSLKVSVKAQTEVVKSLNYSLASVMAHRFQLTLTDTRGNTVAKYTLTLDPGFIHDDSYGSTLYSDTALDLWWTDSMRRVHPGRPSPSGRSTEIYVSAARNERESFQLVLRRTSGAAASLVSAVSVSGLVGPGGAVVAANTSVIVKRVGYVTTALTSDALGEAGAQWPDPLYPDVRVLARIGENVPFLITLHIGPNVPTGDYFGNASVVIDTVTKVVALRLHVFDFGIPKHTKLRSRIGLDTDAINLYHKVNVQDVEKTWNLYLRVCEAYRISPSFPNRYRREYGTVDNSTSPSHIAMHWEEFDQHYKSFFDSENGFGFTFLDTGLLGMNIGTRTSRTTGSIGGYPWGTPEHAALFKEYAGAIEAHYKEKGLLSKASTYWFYNPAPADYDYVKDGMAKIKNAAPNLKRMMPSEGYIAELDNYVDAWYFILAQYTEGFADFIHAKGKTVWTCLQSYPRFPNLGMFIDNPGTSLRSWLWFVFREGIDGIALNAANFWTSDMVDLQDPYVDTMAWTVTRERFGNGNERLLYPPVQWANKTAQLANVPPVESIRLVQLRDGIEDWDYLTVLRELMVQRSLTPQLQEKARSVLNVTRSIIRTDTDFTWDPSEIIAARNAVAQLIEEIIHTCPIPTDATVVITFNPNDLVGVSTEQLVTDIAETLGIPISLVTVEVINETDVLVTIGGTSSQESAANLIGVIQGQVCN